MTMAIGDGDGDCDDNDDDDDDDLSHVHKCPRYAYHLTSKALTRVT